MMIIETERLRIVPLTVEQFSLLLAGIDKVEQDMGLTPSNEFLNRHVQKAMECQYQKMTDNIESYIWYTNRQIILKSENKAIASANFKNSPQEDGCVEIGYGTNIDYRNRGYMTEAIQAMCKWALNQPNVKYIIAETDKDNPASHKVLQKCGMTKYKETEASFWWRLSKDSFNK